MITTRMKSNTNPHEIQNPKFSDLSSKRPELAYDGSVREMLAISGFKQL